MSLKAGFLCTAIAVEICCTLKGADMDIRSLADHIAEHVRSYLPPSGRQTRNALTRQFDAIGQSL